MKYIKDNFCRISKMEYKKGDIVSVTRSNYPAIIIEKINKEHANITSYLISIREFNGDYCIFKKDDISKMYLNDYKIIYEILNYGMWWINEHRDIFLNTLLRLI